MPETDTVLPVIEETLPDDKQDIILGDARTDTTTNIVEETVTTDVEFTNVETGGDAADKAIDAVSEAGLERDASPGPAFEEAGSSERAALRHEEI